MRHRDATGQGQQVDIGIDNTGVCYQNDFYPKDNGTDWGCSFSVGKVTVVVQTVADRSTNARDISVAVAKNV